MNKVEQVITIGKDLGVTTLVLTGDSTDIKAPSSYGIEQVRKNFNVFSKLKEQFSTILDIPGNHSLPFSSYEYLDQSFYDLLVKQNLVTDISYTYHKEEDYYIYGVPYLTHTDLVLEEVRKADKNAPDKLVIVLHEHLVPTEEDRIPYGHYLTYQNITEGLKNTKYIIAGHLHRGFPVMKYNGVTIINQWSFTRLARNYYALNKEHIPQVTYINGDEVKTFDLNVRFDDCFITEELKKEEQLEMNISDFVNSVSEIKSSDNYIESIPDNIREKVSYYLEMAKNKVV